MKCLKASLDFNIGFFDHVLNENDKNTHHIKKAHIMQEKFWQNDTITICLDCEVELIFLGNEEPLAINDTPGVEARSTIEVRPQPKSSCLFEK